MSLQVWLPLTKDTRQQGLSNISVTGTPASWGNGKLGKCATWNGVVANVLYNNTTDFNYTNNFSVAFWANPIYTGSTAQYAWTVGRADAGGYGYGFQIISATTAQFRFGNGSYGVSAPSNEWHHFAMTIGNSKVTIYKDGIQVGSNNLPGTIPTYSDGNGMGLGCFHYSGNIYPYYGSLNDFRIYDHCLSPMEVKELAKGLVLHYPLNRQGWGQNNLIVTNSMAPTSGTSGWSSAGTGWANSNVASSEASNGHVIRCTYSGTTQVSGGIHHPTGVDKTTLTTGAFYTLTARIRASKACIATFYNELMTTSNTINLTTDWKIYSYSCKIDNTRSYHSNVIYVRAADAVQNMWIECDWIKLEEGAKSTPWVPNSAETLYTTMGLNSTTEYDCSGFCNNGTRIGTFTWTSDTPKYEVSTEFNASYPNYIQVPNSYYALQGAEAMTVSVWAYMNDWTSFAARIYSSTEGGGYNIEYSGSNLQWPVNVYTAADKSTYAYASSNPNLYLSVTKSSLTSGWHMFTWVYDTIGTKLYVDGELKTSKVATSYGIHFSTAAPLIIGGEATGTGATTPYFTGKQSDFRIYATALSASDVKSLYQNCATIDPDGTIRGQIRS